MQKIALLLLTFDLKFSFTDVADPVQLISISPKTRDGCAKPNLATTLAPAPSPNPIT